MQTGMVGGKDFSIALIDEKVHMCLSQLDQMRLKSVLDIFGRNSAKAQGLSGPITDLLRARTHHHNVYIAARREGKKTTIFGYIKTGRKKLFMTTQMGRFEEIEPVCVLDFYVHESSQRIGIGRALYEAVLEGEHQAPATMAYDRPSPKLLAFLKRHYGLSEYIPQANNFVVYKQYWDAVGRSRREEDDAYTSIAMQPLTGQRDRRVRKEVDGRTVLDQSKQKSQFTLRQGFYDHSSYQRNSPGSSLTTSPHNSDKKTAADGATGRLTQREVDELASLLGASTLTVPFAAADRDAAPSASSRHSVSSRAPSVRSLQTGQGPIGAAVSGPSPPGGGTGGAYGSASAARTASIKALAGNGARGCLGGGAHA